MTAFLLNLVGFGFAAFAEHVLHLGFPYNSVWLHDPKGTDLIFAAPLFQHIHTAQFFSQSVSVPFMYPAALSPFFALFLNASNPWLALDLFIGLTAVLGAYFFGRSLRSASVPLAHSIAVPIVLVFLSYPLGFDLKQCNTEILVWIPVASAIWLFRKGMLKASAVLIGCAIAMKIFPFVYLGLFLARRRFVPIVIAVATAALVTLFSLLYLGPTISVAWHGIAGNLAYYQQTVPLVYRQEIGYDHSIFALLKTAVHEITKHRMVQPSFQPLLRLYLLLAALTGVVVYFVYIRALPFLNQVLCLTLCSILLPPTSYDYTLLHLYIPLALLILFVFRQPALRMRGLNYIFVGLAFATSIDTEFIVGSRTIGAQLKCIALLGLLFAALRYPITSATEPDTLTGSIGGEPAQA